MRSNWRSVEGKITLHFTRGIQTQTQTQGKSCSFTSLKRVLSMQHKFARHIYTEIAIEVYLQLPCIKIQDITTLCSRLKGLNFNLKLTKLSRNPGKNKISQIISKAVA